ncbi:MAG TPA: hypothetical protein VMW80_02880 [Candidatus Dormibacteraeota bacterium]|nr:hypothetical protein [Candidatus Dormibacteraeota bacterium]
MTMLWEEFNGQLELNVPKVLAYALAKLRSCGVQITPGVEPGTVVITGVVPSNLRGAVGYPPGLRLALDREAAATSAEEEEEEPALLREVMAEWKASSWLDQEPTEGSLRRLVAEVLDAEMASFVSRSYLEPDGGTVSFLTLYPKRIAP